MEDYIKEVSNNLDFISNSLNDLGNGVFLTNREIEVLDKYNIDYKNKPSLNSILFEIEDILSDENYDDLDLISESISERVYYNDINK